MSDELPEHLQPKKRGRPPGQKNKSSYPVAKGRATTTRMPKKIEAVCILLTDNGQPSDIPLDMFEMDRNPLTAHLPLHEKKVILQHWPTWQQHLKDVHDYKLAQSQVLTGVHATAVALSRVKTRLKLNTMALGEQLNVASTAFAEEVLDASLRLAKTDAEKALADPTALALYKHRITHVKDMLAIARQLTDLGTRFEQADAKVIPTYAMSEEAENMLAEARSVMSQRGIKLDGSA